MPLRDPAETAAELISAQNTYNGHGRVVGYRFAFEPTNTRRIIVCESLVDISSSIIVDERELAFRPWLNRMAELGNRHITSADAYELEKRVGVTLLQGISNG